MKNRIVADGGRRAREAAIAQVRAEVARELREAFEKAPLWKRLLLRLRMEVEVRRRMRRAAPPDGLFIRPPPGGSPSIGVQNAGFGTGFRAR